MAQVPTPERIKEIQDLTKSAIAAKKQAQAEEGKTFVLPKGGGPGVIPEDVWQQHKAAS